MKALVTWIPEPCITDVDASDGELEMAGAWAAEVGQCTASVALYKVEDGLYGELTICGQLYTDVLFADIFPLESSEIQKILDEAAGIVYNLSKDESSDWKELLCG